MDGWQRGGDPSRGVGRFESSGGALGGSVGGGRGGGRGGIAGSGIGPLTLVEGAKKLFQDVSEDAMTGWTDSR
jgi:hypothetical protein